MGAFSGAPLRFTAGSFLLTGTTNPACICSLPLGIFGVMATLQPHFNIWIFNKRINNISGKREGESVTHTLPGSRRRVHGTCSKEGYSMLFKYHVNFLAGYQYVADLLLAAEVPLAGGFGVHHVEPVHAALSARLRKTEISSWRPTPETLCSKVTPHHGSVDKGDPAVGNPQCELGMQGGNDHAHHEYRVAGALGGFRTMGGAMGAQGIGEDLKREGIEDLVDQYAAAAGMKQTIIPPANPTKGPRAKERPAAPSTMTVRDGYHCGLSGNMSPQLPKSAAITAAKEACTVDGLREDETNCGMARPAHVPRCHILITGRWIKRCSTIIKWRQFRLDETNTINKAKTECGNLKRLLEITPTVVL
ncbi:hypothetical protein BDK51DRAFT_29753 [Blyttiomyces helicus]|uniref:Uncharacterized protein n=1 Tax=Blyttiomyces helicus TaxID=388810 RepID=A0A4P9WLN1_9FUNG|nr:hypothetical protein BDK51DRAFT_29753 [Blyttiomyces helicus]|eukprot:RKO93332.1 hypothetical protein BDK51DRAFT_29753 [Blyttiomyces helicus]